MTAIHDLGWLKRQDRGNGITDMIGGFGEVVATVWTENVDHLCRNGERVRVRLACPNSRP